MSMKELIKMRNSLGYGNNSTKTAGQDDLLEYRNRINKKISTRDDPDAVVDADYLDQYFSDHHRYWSEHGAGALEATNKYYRLDERRASIDDWLDSSLADGIIDQDYYDAVTKALNDADSYVGMYQGQREFGNYINDWNDWYSNSANALNGMDWSTGRAGSSVLDDGMTGFAERDAAAREWLETYKSQLGDEYYNSVMDYLNGFGGMTDELRAAYDQNAEYFNKWDTQEAYDISQMSADELRAQMDRIGAAGDDLAIVNDLLASNNLPVFNMPDAAGSPEYDMVMQDREYIANKYGITFSDDYEANREQLEALAAQLEEMDSPVAYTTKDGQNVTWQMLLDNRAAAEDLQKRLEEYSQNADWEEKSQMIMQQSDTDSDYTIIYSLAQSSVPYDWETAEAYGYTREEFDAEDQRRRYIESKYGVDLHSGGAEANMALRDLLLETDPGVSREKDTFDDFRYMTDDERRVLSYIYNTEGRDAALAWHEGREWIYENEAINAINQEGLQYGYEHPIWGTLWHIGANIGGGFEQIGNMVDYAKTGELHQNRSAARAAALTAGTSERVDWNIGNWDAFDFVYQTTVSGADSLVNATLFGPAAEVMLGLSAAASATNDALNRGMSNKQAFWTGITAGTFEGIFEHLSIGELRAMKEVASASGKQIALNIAKSMLTNASEEMLTEIANVVYDLIVNGDFSQYETTIRKYEAMGLDPEDAKKKAAVDLGLQVVESGASGALMGLGFGVSGQTSPIIGNAIDAAQYRKLPKTVRNSVKRLQDLGMDRVQAIRTSITLNMSAEAYGEHAAEYMAAFDPKQDPYTYASDFQKAYEIGKNNGNQDYIKQLSLNETQAEIAYKLGQQDQGKAAKVAEERPDVDTDYVVSKDGQTVDIRSGEAVEVTGFKSVGKNAELETKNGSIKAQDVSFATEDEAVFYEVIGRTIGTANMANNVLQAYKQAAKDGMSASDFAAGLQQAYDLGFKGQVAERQLGTYELAGALPVGVRSAAFNQGKRMGDIQASSRDADIRKQGGQAKGERKGTFHFDRKGRTFSAKQETSLKALEALSKAIGVDIYIYESYEKGGKRYFQDRSGGKIAAPNGYYDAKGIHIDLNAGNFGQGTMMFAAAHELTHFIHEWSPVKFRKLADLLIERYAEQGTSVRELIDNQILKAKNNGRTIDRDTAFQEVVADSMEAVLVKGDMAKVLAELKQTDRTLAQKIREWFKDLAQKLQAVVNSYKGVSPESPEGRLVAQMDDFIEVLQQAYAEALVDAGESYRASEGAKTETKKLTAAEKAALDSLVPGEEGVVVDAKGEPVAYNTGDGTVMLSMRTYEDEGRIALRNYLQKCVKNKSLTQQEMTEMLDGIEEIYEACKEFKDKYAPFGNWSNAEVIRDTKGKPVFSVVTPNGEYKMNLDFSLVCRKRRTLDAVFNEMARRGIIDDFELGQKSIVKINEIIRKYGLETACALCFVDAKRFRQASMADSFVRLYNELLYSMVPEDKHSSLNYHNFSGYNTIKQNPDGVDTWKNSELDFSHLDKVMREYGSKTVEYKTAAYLKKNPGARKLLLRGDFMGSKGFDAVKVRDKNILSLYNSKKGTGGPKAAFGDVQYLNEIIKNSRGWSPEKAFEVGGVRIQSFSDYVPRMVFDYVQMIYDLAAKKLPAHAYTKEFLFVQQFGLTGTKINMSLIPAVAKDGVAPGLDKNGNYVWAGESFDFDTAKKIQSAEGYTENCGTICVGVSKAHIEKLLSDPDIRMVIPYHKSGLNPIVAHMNKIAAFTDYTSLKTNPGGCQSTTDKNGSKVEQDFFFNQAMQRLGDAKLAADEYKKWCAEKGYTPKFAEFAWHPNYYKLLIDFTVYDKDGNYVPQRAVKAVFPKKENAFGSMKSLIESGLQEDAVIEGRRSASLGAIVDEIQKVIPKTEDEIADEEVEQADRDVELDRNTAMLSDRDPTAAQTAAALEKQNAKLREDVKELRELLRLQGKVTKQTEFRKSSVDAAVTSLAKEVMAKLDAEDRTEMRRMLTDLYKFVASDENLAWEGVAERAGKIADFLQERVNIKPQLSEYQQDVLKYLRGQKIRLSDSQRAEVDKLYGYEHFRKTLFGAGIYISKNGMELDSLWHEASDKSMFPGTFAEDTVEGDQPAELLRIIDAMREADDSDLMEYAYNREFIRQDLIRSIYDSYWRVDNLYTVADKKQKQIEDIRKKHRELMEEIRKDQQHTLYKMRAIRENLIETVKTDYSKDSYYSVQTIANAWKTDRKQKLSEFKDIEKEFIRLAKDFEKFGKEKVKERAKDQKGFEKAQKDARKEFERELQKEAAKHDKDNKLWTREFERLMKEYDRSGQKIERLEERIEKGKETRAASHQRSVVEKAAKDLMEMLSKPTKDAHVPMELQKPLEKFLDSIDFTSAKALAGGEPTIRDVAYTRALQDVKTAIAAQRSAMAGDDGKFTLDVPANFIDKIDEHISVINKATEGLDLTTNRVYEMTSDELKDLAFILKTINKAIREIDKLHMAGAKARVSELANETVREMGRRKGTKTDTGSVAMWAMYTPTSAFERMGTAAVQVLNGLKQGQSKLARTAAAVIEFARDTYTKKEVKQWGKEVHDIKLDSGETVKMTTAQIMSFYCLSHREHAKGHLTGGGIRIGNIGEGRKATIQRDHYRLTIKDIAKINGMLTDRQRTVANKLQRYMADVGGRLGNEISMARWDYMEMTEKDYFPIKSDSDIHDARNPDQERANLWGLLNKSFTKALTEGANDAVVVSSIFDVFANHMSEMAEYNAFALPLVDAMKWFNYRDTTKLPNGQIKTVGVKKALNDTLGTSAGKYFIDLMTDVNSSQKGGRYENLFGKLLSRSKGAAVGWNLRVAMQQPTAILRASMYLDPLSLAKGFVRFGSKKLGDEMLKYSGIAQWKDLGYYDLNISRGITEQIKGDDSILDKINDAGMWLPGKMDRWTWTSIWAATKSKVEKDTKLKGEALLQKTAETFEDIVYHTQVADSVLTRSGLMRSKSQTLKEMTSFMAEPTMSINLLMSAFQDYREGVTTGKKAKRALRIAFCGYVLSSVANAFVISLADAWRDDDEYEEFREKYLQALLGEKFIDGNLFAELNPIEKIVFVRDVLSLIQGYEGSKNAYIELVESAVKLLGNVKKFMEGKGSLTVYGLIYQSLQVLGGFTGAAPANFTREAISIWNNTFGKWNGMMIHRYVTDTKTSIKDAYKTGALTKREAQDALIADGMTIADAYYTVKKWDTGNDSKYADLYSAALAGGDLADAIAEIVQYGGSEKKAMSQLKSQIGTWYTDPDSETKISRDQAESMLRKYFDMDDAEVEEILLGWDMKVDSGFSLSGLKQEFLDEVVSADDAVDYLIRYGRMDEEDARQKVDSWAFEAENGYSFDDIRQTYLDEDITADEAMAVLMERAGKTKDEAKLSIELWDFERENGWRYENRATLYKGGDITADQLIDALIDLGDYTRKEARYQVEVYDWEKAGLEGASVKRVETWHEYCQGAGISKETYLKIVKYSSNTKNDVDEDGEPIRYSAMKKVMAEIDKLPLSDSQKDALAKAMGWSDRNIRKYKPW